MCSRQVVALLLLSSHLSNGNASHALRGKDSLVQEPERALGLRVGQPRLHARGGGRRREGLLWRGDRRPGGLAPDQFHDLCSRGARDSRFPRGPASLARWAAPTWLSAAAAPLPGSPGTFCANLTPGPTPRQTPGSRPEEAHRRSSAPREPDPRGGGSGFNLNTSPAPPRPPSAMPRGPSARRSPA